MKSRRLTVNYRRDFILGLLKEATEPALMKELVTMLSYNWNLTRRTIQEDVNVLIDFGKIIKSDNGRKISIRKERFAKPSQEANDSTLKKQEA